MQSKVARIVQARTREVGGHRVGRVLPAVQQRAVGPFVFFDHMGPVTLAPGEGFDVRPHPHIGLSTVTYLFDGEIVHRDSLGSLQTIRPNELNWMTAGRGIVHSERAAPELRRAGGRLHGLQLWVGLPLSAEETTPSFEHYAADALPTLKMGAVSVRVIAGTLFGATSRATTHSRLFYAEASLPAGAELSLEDEYPERALYVVEGELALDCAAYGEHGMLVLEPGRVEVCARRETRVVLLGGEPLDGPRHVEWNFVSSSRERIEAAKRLWRAAGFPLIPGDSAEFIPIPP